MEITDYLVDNGLLKTTDSELERELHKRKLRKSTILKLLKQGKVEKRGKSLIIKLG